MSDRQETKQVEVDESSDEPAVFVVDPDDYQKTRKIKAINDAKDRVREVRENYPKRASSKEWDALRARTSEAVGMYGSELLPLVEDALEAGLLDEEDLETEYGSLREFIHFDGRLPNGNGTCEPAPPPAYMAFYRQLERIQRKLGLGLELREKKGPAKL